MEKRTLVSLFGALLTLAAGCGDEEKEGGASCEAICERIEAADCALAAPSCLQTCQEDNEETPVACKAKLDALSGCFGRATFQCDADGYPEANGCKTELEAWLDCREREGDGPDPQQGDDLNQDADDDIDPGDQGEWLSCNPKAGADECDQCVGDSCCAEIEACGADCQALFSCIDSCTNDFCFEACAKAHPRSVSALGALSECLEAECAVECNGGTDEPNTGDDLSESCLPSSVPDGYCDGTGKKFAHDCPLAKPYPDCVLSPTGAANVYCCNQ